MILDFFTLFTELADCAVVVSLLLVAYQIWLQRRDLRFTANEGLMSDFSQMTLFLVDHPQIARQVYSDSGVGDAELAGDLQDRQMALYYLDGLLGLFERAWWASKQSKARREDWIGWRNWLKSLAKSSLFAELLKSSEGEWEPAFREELRSILAEIQTEKGA
jgi:hypothetical protein